jgi:hypothetical protein
MKFRVVVAASGGCRYRGLPTCTCAIELHKPAERRLRGIEKAIGSLSTLPRRHGIARESAEFEEEIRQMLYGKRGYRVLFIVRDDTVHVLQVRHEARSNLTSNELQLDE